MSKNSAKNDNDNVTFKKGDKVVYPVHGVGEIEGLETHDTGSEVVHFYAISFAHERMRLKIPVFKANAAGLRKLCTGDRFELAMTTLKGRARVRRTMWSRRAAEYEAKINSGDPVLVAEVLRDLKKSRDGSEQSYSERQIYQSALQRLAREVAAVDSTSEDVAADKLEAIMGVSKDTGESYSEPESESAKMAAEIIANARKEAA